MVGNKWVVTIMTMGVNHNGTNELQQRLLVTTIAAGEGNA